MSRTVGHLLAALIVGGPASMQACTSSPPALTPAAAAAAAEQAEVAAYGLEEQECVARAQDRAGADVCLMAVRARWCGDGGALAARGDCPDQVVGNAARLDSMMVHAASVAGAVTGAVVVDAGGER